MKEDASPEPEKFIEIKKEVSVKIYHWKDLNKLEHELLRSANSARSNALARYSKFLVGAAVLWRNGLITSGCNMEGCAWEALHAERAAIASGVQRYGGNKINAVAVVGAWDGDEFDFPPRLTRNDFEKAASKVKFEDASVSCGYCLQDIVELAYGDRDIPLLGLMKTGVIVKIKLGDILTAWFEPKSLGVDYSKNKK
jgi:cytidine deaminase